MNTLNRRQLLLAGLAVTALPFGIQAATPAVPGTWTDGQWTDPARGRSIPWRLRLPATPGPWPLVLFSHGLGGSREGGAVWGDAWQAAGFMVLNLQHVGSDTTLLKTQGPRALRAAASAQELVARVQDVQFVLDEIERQSKESTSPWAACQRDAIGLAGHSFGAQTAQALAGQYYGVGQAPIKEARLKSFVLFSPNLGNDRMPPAQAFGHITSPVLCLTGTLDGDPLARETDVQTAVAKRRLVYQGLPAGDKAELLLQDADHFTFGGNPVARAGLRRLPREPAATFAETAHHGVIASISTAWWNAYLRLDSNAINWLRAPVGLSTVDQWSRG
jgi:dienelactone hydrolase